MQLYKLRKNKKKEINSASHVFNKDLDEFWVQNLFFPKHYLLQSYTSYSATHAKKKKKNIESYPLKTAIGLPCCFERPIIMVNMC